MGNKSNKDNKQLDVVSCLDVLERDQIDDSILAYRYFEVITRLQ